MGRKATGGQLDLIDFAEAQHQVRARFQEGQIDSLCEQLEMARKLLQRWQGYALSLAAADIIATPDALHRQTTAFLDATAC